MSQKIQIFRLEDRVLFEAGGAVEAAAAEQSVEQQQAVQADASADGSADAHDTDASDTAAAPDAAGSADVSDTAAAPDADATGVHVDADADGDASADGDALADLPILPTDDTDIHFTDSDLHSQDAGTLTMDLLAETETISAGRELVIINSGVADTDSILSALSGTQDVLQLEDGEDGMARIQSYLDASGTKYDAIHFVTHGGDGYFVLNGEKIDADSFDASEWSAIGEHLNDGGDLLFYGCDLAKSEAGQTLCREIADASGADVAASDDATGVTGDWDLEFTTGAVGTDSIQVDGYESRLQNWNVTLTTDADTVNGDISGSDYNLRYAVVNSVAGDTITFDDSINTDAPDSYITLNAQITLDHGISIDGAFTDGSHLTVMVSSRGVWTNGNTNANASAYRVFYITGTNVTLENLTLIGGHVTDANILGGTVAIGDTSTTSPEQIVTLSHVDITGGWSARGGLWIQNRNADSLITLNDVNIYGNYGDSYGGGAFFLGNVDMNGGSIHDNKVAGATAGQGGAGLYISSYNFTEGSHISLSGTELYNNVLTSASGWAAGSAIYAKSATGMTVLSLDNVSIHDNTATGHGGAVALRESAVALIVRDSDFYSNTSTGAGAILVDFAGTTVEISSSVFYNNSAANGGAISNTANSAIFVHDTTFYNNTATASGGAISNTASAGSLLLVNDTFVNNTAAANGGAVYESSTGVRAVSVNSIFSGNTANGASSDVSGKLAAYYSFYTTATDVTGTGNSVGRTADEIFGTGWSFNTETGVIALSSAAASKIGGVLSKVVLTDGTGAQLYYSPAYDAETPEWISAGSYTGAVTAAMGFTNGELTTDQTGGTRKVHSSSTLSTGAYALPFEGNYTQETASATVTTTRDIVNAFDGVISLREALAYCYADPTLGKILFDVNGETVLLDAQIVIAADVVINGLDVGTGARASVSVNTGAAARVFDITAGTISISNLILTGGDVGAEGGGVIRIPGTANVTLNGVTLTGGTARNGGAIYIFGNDESSHAKLTLINSVVTGNSGPANSYGSGIYANYADLVVINSTFSANTVGAGALSAANGTLLMINSTVTGNTSAIDTGGLRLSGVTASIYNSILSGNTLNGAANDIAIIGTTTVTARNVLYSAGSTLTGTDVSVASESDIFGTNTINAKGIRAISESGPAFSSSAYYSYVAASGAVFLSTDDEATWTEVTATGAAYGGGIVSGADLNYGYSTIDAAYEAYDPTYRKTYYVSNESEFSSAVTGINNGGTTYTGYVIQMTDSFSLTAQYKLTNNAATVTISGSDNEGGVYTLSQGADLTTAMIHIYKANMTLTVRDIQFAGSGVATSMAGAIFSSYAGLTLTVENAEFSNFVSSSDGGAINTRGGSVTISNSDFHDNTAKSGGVIFSSSDSTLNISHSTFTDNNAMTGGGAVYFSSSLTGSIVSISTSTFTNNSLTYKPELASNAIYMRGGAVYLEFSNASGATVDMTDVTFTGNNIHGVQNQYGGVTSYMGAGGGAVYLQKGTLNLTGTNVFSNNSAVVEFNIGRAETYPAYQSLSATGGALSMNNAIGFSITGSTTFDGNYAEAISDGGQSGFNSNDIACGGAVFLNSELAKISITGTGTEVNFTGNHVLASTDMKQASYLPEAYGGALAVYGFSQSSDAYFKNNPQHIAIQVSDATLNFEGNSARAEILSASNVSNASAAGGGAFINGIYGRLWVMTVENSTLNFADNSATCLDAYALSAPSARGGGAFLFGAISSTLLSSTGVTIDEDPGFNIINSHFTFTNNSVGSEGGKSLLASGGAVFAVGSDMGTRILEVTADAASGATFTGNRADYGGGLYLTQSNTAGLWNLTFLNNTAQIGGGGMYVSGSVTTLINATFTGNQAFGTAPAQRGDAIYVGGGAGSSFTLIDSTLIGGGGDLVLSMYGNNDTQLYIVNSVILGGKIYDIYNPQAAQSHFYYNVYGNHSSGANYAAGNVTGATAAAVFGGNQISFAQNAGVDIPGSGVVAVITGSAADGAAVRVGLDSSSNLYYFNGTNWTKAADNSTTIASVTTEFTVDQRGATRANAVAGAYDTTSSGVTSVTISAQSFSGEYGTYDGGAVNFTTAVGAFLVTYAVSFDAAGQISAGGYLNAGAYALTGASLVKITDGAGNEISLEDFAAYCDLTLTVESGAALTVTAKTLTVKVADTGILVGGTPSYSFSAFGGKVIAGDSLDLVYTAYDAENNPVTTFDTVGSYTVKGVFGTGGDNANYNFVWANEPDGTLDVADTAVVNLIVTIGTDVVADDGETSLREAMTIANASTNAAQSYRITFKDTVTTVTLAARLYADSISEIVIDGDLSIHSETGVTGSVVLTRNAAVDVLLNASALTIRNTDWTGGTYNSVFVYNFGTLAAENVNVTAFSTTYASYGVVMYNGGGAMTLDTVSFSGITGTGNSFIRMLNGSLTMNDVTFTGGATSYVYADSAAVTITGTSVFQGGTTTNTPSLYLAGSNSSLTIGGHAGDDIRFLSNNYNAIQMSASGTATIRNATFAGNVSTSAGAAISLTGGIQADVLIEDCYFGVIYDTDGTTVLVDGNQMTGTNSGGGAISIDNLANGSSVVIRNSDFVGNYLTANGSSGGAVRVVGGTVFTVSVEGCDFTGNHTKETSGTGGAIVSSNAYSTLNVSDSTFTGNHSNSSGSAIYSNSQGTHLNNVTFTDNTSYQANTSIAPVLYVQRANTSSPEIDFTLEGQIVFTPQTLTVNSLGFNGGLIYTNGGMALKSGATLNISNMNWTLTNTATGNYGWTGVFICADSMTMEADSSLVFSGNNIKIISNSTATDGGSSGVSGLVFLNYLYADQAALTAENNRVTVDNSGALKKSGNIFGSTFDVSTGMTITDSDIVIRNNIAEVDTVNNTATLNGTFGIGGSTADRTFAITGGTLTITGNTLKAVVTGTGNAAVYGAGIGRSDTNAASHLLIRGVYEDGVCSYVFADNQFDVTRGTGSLTALGTDIYSPGWSGRVEIENISFTAKADAATNAVNGGAIFLAGSELKLTRVSVSGYTTNSNGSGAYLNVGANGITLENVSFSNNTLTDGVGALYLRRNVATATAEFRGVNTLSGNTAKAVDMTLWNNSLGAASLYVDAFPVTFAEGAEVNVTGSSYFFRTETTTGSYQTNVFSFSGLGVNFAGDVTMNAGSILNIDGTTGSLVYATAGTSNGLTLDGGALRISGLLTMTGATLAVTGTQITMDTSYAVNKSASVNGAGAFFGNGFAITDSIVTISGNSMSLRTQNGQLTAYGAGFYIANQTNYAYSMTGGMLTVSNNTITAETTGSGVIYAYGAGLGNYGAQALTLTLEGSASSHYVFSGNAISVSTSGTSTSLASCGSDIYLYSAAKTVALKNIDFTAKTDSTVTRDGGSISATSMKTLALEGLSFTGYNADGSAGAIYISATDALSMKDCSFTNNTVRTGGGALCIANAGGTLTVSGTNTFTGNRVVRLEAATNGWGHGAAAYIDTPTVFESGAKFIADGNSVYIEQVGFTNNVDILGGVLRFNKALTMNSGSEISISNSQIKLIAPIASSVIYTSSIQGGALYTSSGTTLTGASLRIDTTQVLMDYSLTPGRGCTVYGGAWNLGGTTTLTDSTISVTNTYVSARSNNIGLTIFGTVFFSGSSTYSGTGNTFITTGNTLEGGSVAGAAVYIQGVGWSKYADAASTLDFSNTASALFADNVMRANTTGGRTLLGGDIYWKGNAGTSFTLDHATFTATTRQTDVISGGAVCTVGTDFTLSDSTFTGYSVTNNGGALNLNNTGVTTLSNLTFTDNHAYGAGAICVAGTTLYMTNITLTGNSSSNAAGAVYISTSGLAEIVDSTFAGNTAPGNGAAIYHASAGTLALVNTTIVSGTGARHGIYSTQGGATYYILNSIVVGSANDIQLSASNTKVYVWNSVVGVTAHTKIVNGSQGNITGAENGANVLSLFGSHAVEFTQTAGKDVPGSGAIAVVSGSVADGAGVLAGRNASNVYGFTTDGTNFLSAQDGTTALTVTTTFNSDQHGAVRAYNAMTAGALNTASAAAKADLDILVEGIASEYGAYNGSTSLDRTYIHGAFQIVYTIAVAFGGTGGSGFYNAGAYDITGAVIKSVSAGGVELNAAQIAEYFDLLTATVDAGAQLTLSKRAITVAADRLEIVVGSQPDFTFTATSGTVLSGDDVVLDYTVTDDEGHIITTFDTVDAVYTITPAIGTGGDNANYDIMLADESTASLTVQSAKVSIIVTIGTDTVADDGETSLREAVELANSSINYGRVFDITFASDVATATLDKVLTVTSKAQVVIDGDLAINGGTAGDRVTLARSTNVIMFDFATDGSFTFRNLTVTGSSYASDGIRVTHPNATLTLDHVSISNFTNTSANAVESAGNLILKNSDVTAVSYIPIYSTGGSVTIIDTLFHDFNANTSAVRVNAGTLLVQSTDTTSGAYSTSFYNMSYASGDITGGAIYLGANVTSATITASFRGIVSTSATTNVLGGAIYSQSAGTITLDHSEFIGNGRMTAPTNTSAVSGGAVDIDNKNATVIISDSLFDGNKSWTNNNSWGGALFIQAVSSTITNSTFTNNSAVINTGGNNHAGGAIYFYSGDVSISGCTFTGNTSTNRGGALFIRNADTAHATTVKISDSTFTNNSVPVGDGGAILVMNNGNGEGVADSVLIEGCTFTGNSALNYGGAVSINSTTVEAKDVTIRNSEFISNSTKNGGALYIKLNGATLLDNVRMYGNSATNSGGAIFLAANDAACVCTVRDSYFGSLYDAENVLVYAGNTITGTEGGAIYTTAKMSIENSQFVENSIQYTNAANGNISVLGGAIRAANTNTDITITGSKFIRNGIFAETTSDAGAYQARLTGGAICTSSALTVSDTLFDGNWLDGRSVKGQVLLQGAAIYCGNANLTVTGSAGSTQNVFRNQTLASTTTGNTEIQGGVIYHESLTSITTLSNLVFDNNDLSLTMAGNITVNGSLIRVGNTSNAALECHFTDLVFTGNDAALSSTGSATGPTWNGMVYMYASTTYTGGTFEWLGATVTGNTLALTSAASASDNGMLIYIYGWAGANLTLGGGTDHPFLVSGNAVTINTSGSCTVNGGIVRLSSCADTTLNWHDITVSGNTFRYTSTAGAVNLYGGYLQAASNDIKVNFYGVNSFSGNETVALAVTNSWLVGFGFYIYGGTDHLAAVHFSDSLTFSRETVSFTVSTDGCHSRGGAMSFSYSAITSDADSSILVDQCTMSFTVAKSNGYGYHSDASGLAMLIDGCDSTFNGSVAVTDCALTLNATADVILRLDGGMIHYGLDTVVFQSLILTGNQVTFNSPLAGVSLYSGIFGSDFNAYNRAAESLTVQSGIMSNNVVSVNSGVGYATVYGGLFQGRCDVTLRNMTIAGNSVSVTGASLSIFGLGLAYKNQPVNTSSQYEMLYDDALFLLADSTLSGNTFTVSASASASIYGALVHFGYESKTGFLTRIEGSLFENNKLTSDFAGTGTMTVFGMVNINPNGSTASYQTGIADSVFRNNSITVNQTDGTVHLRGGAIAASNSNADLSIADSVFEKNSVTLNSEGGSAGDVFGAAILSYASAFNVSGCTFSENTAVDGGAIYLTAGGTISGSSFFGNTGSYRGGAIWSNGGALVLENITVSGNTAQLGGAVYLYSSAANSLSVVGSTIVGNSSGLWFYSAATPLNIVNSIVAWNGADTARNDIEYNTNATGAVNFIYSVIGAYTRCTPADTSTITFVSIETLGETLFGPVVETDADGEDIPGQKTYYVHADSLADGTGTLAGKIGGVYYYLKYDVETGTIDGWYEVGGTTKAFDYNDAASDLGLTGGTILGLDQIGTDRALNYTAGAVSRIVQTVDLTVDSVTGGEYGSYTVDGPFTGTQDGTVGALAVTFALAYELPIHGIIDVSPAGFVNAGEYLVNGAAVTGVTTDVTGSTIVMKDGLITVKQGTETTGYFIVKTILPTGADEAVFTIQSKTLGGEITWTDSRTGNHYTGESQLDSITMDASGVTGVLTGDTLTTETVFADDPTFTAAGDYTAAVSSLNSNYKLDGVTGASKAFTIAQAEITITPTTASGRTDGSRVTVSVGDIPSIVFAKTITGDSPSDLGSLSFKLVNAEGTEVDPQTFAAGVYSLKYILNGTDANYDITSSQITLVVVDSGTITNSIGGISGGVYGDAPDGTDFTAQKTFTTADYTITLDYTLAVNIGAEDVSDAGFYNAGAYDISSAGTPGVSINNDYSVSINGNKILVSKDGTDLILYTLATTVDDGAQVTITAKSIDGSVSWTDSRTSSVYNGQSQKGGISAAITSTGILEGDSVALDLNYSGDGLFTNAGNYTATASNANGNYAFGTVTGLTSGTLSIARKEVTVSGLTANDKVFDGGTDAVVVTDDAVFTGIVTGDALTVSTTGTFDTKHVGTDKVVTFGTLTLGGDDAANYSVKSDSQTDTAADITAKAIKITVTDQANTTYGDAVTPAYTTDVTLCSGDSFTGSLAIDGSVSTSGNYIVGAHNINQGTLAINDGNSGNNYAVTFVGDSFTVAQKAVTVSGLTVADRVYDGTDTATVDRSGASISGAVTGDVVSLNPLTGTFDTKHVGTDKVVTLGTLTLGGADAANYSVKSDSQTETTADITAKAIKITVTDQADTTYGDAVTPAYTTDVELVGLDTFTGALAIDGTVSTSGNWVAGNHNITRGTLAINDGNSGNDYAVTFVGDSFTVARKEVTVSGLTANDKVFDGGTDAVVVTDDAVFTGIVTGDALTVSTTGTFDTKHVGTDKVVTFGTLTLGGDDAANYSVKSDSQTDTAADITAKAIKITVTDQANTTYGDAVTPAYTTDVTLCSGDSFTGSLAIDGSVSTSGNYIVGSHNINQGTLAISDGNSGKNYAVTFVGDSFTVAQKAVTVSGLTVANRVYDGTDTATVDRSGASISGAVTGDVVSLNPLTGTFDTKHVGTDKVVTFGTLTLGGADAANYSVKSDSQTETTADITAKAIKITVTDQADTTYGDAVTPAYTTDVELVGLDTFTGALAIDGTVSTSGNWVAGNHNITRGTLAINDGNSGNDYAVTFVGDSFTVARKEVTVSGLTANDKVFDGGTDAVVVTDDAVFTGIVTGDALTVSTTGTFDTKHVGTDKVVTFGTLTLGGDDAANYSVKSDSQTETTASIFLAERDVVWNYRSSYTYNAADQSATVTGYYLDADGAQVSVTISFDHTFKNAGKYVATVIDADPDYKLDNTTLELAIGRAAVSVKADNLTMNVGGTVPELTYQTSGLMGADRLSGLLDCDATGSTAGTYAITQGSITNEQNANYSIVFTAGELVVSGADGVNADQYPSLDNLNYSSLSITLSELDPIGMRKPSVSTGYSIPVELENPTAHDTSVQTGRLENSDVHLSLDGSESGLAGLGGEFSELLSDVQFSEVADTMLGKAAAFLDSWDLEFDKLTGRSLKYR